MGPVEQRDEVEILRRKLQRRNDLLVTVQRSYLEDVVIVQRVIEEMKKQGHIYEIFCSMKSLPSLNLQPWLQLSSPAECEFAVRSDILSGGYIEVIHREAHKVEQWMKEAKNAKESEAEASAACEDFKRKIDDLNLALEEERRYREEDKLVLLRQIESLRVRTAKQDPRSHEKLNIELKKLREQIKTQQQHIQSLEDSSSTVESLKTRLCQQELDQDANILHLEELKQTRQHLTEILRSRENLEQRQVITEEEVKCLTTQNRAFESREKKMKDRMTDILAENSSLLQTIEGLKSDISCKTTELRRLEVAKDERIVDLQTKISIIDQEWNKGKAIIEQKSSSLEAELLLSKKLKMSLESLKSSYSILQESFRAQEFKVERNNALISRLRRELKDDSKRCREVEAGKMWTRNERGQKYDILNLEQKQNFDNGHNDGNNNSIVASAKDSVGTAGPQVGNKIMMIRFLLLMKSKLIQARLEASYAQHEINQLEVSCSKKEIGVEDRVDEVQRRFSSEIAELQSNLREKDSQATLLKSTLDAKIREGIQGEEQLRQSFDAKVAYYEDRARRKEKELLDEKTKTSEVYNEVQTLKARLEEVHLRLNEATKELQAQKSITALREQVLEANREMSTQTTQEGKKKKLNKECQTTFQCLGLHSLRQPKTPLRTKTVESLLLKERKSLPQDVEQLTDESAEYRTQNNEMKARTISVSRAEDRGKTEVVISLPRLPS
jgi:hypothetical protein